MVHSWPAERGGMSAELGHDGYTVWEEATKKAIVLCPSNWVMALKINIHLAANSYNTTMK